MKIRKRNRPTRKPLISYNSIIPKESVLCKQFVIHVKQLQHYGQLPNEMVVIHIPNENISSSAYRMHLKAMGLIAGVPDYLILYKGVAFLEFKRTKACKLTKSQQKFFDMLKILRIPHVVAYSVEEAITFLKNL